MVHAAAHPAPRGASSWRLWWSAARPATLWAAVGPVAVGSAVAAREGGMRPAVAAAALAGAIAIQVGTNYANDLFDALHGADGPERLGPARAVASGACTPGAMARATAVAFGAALLAGAVLVALSGWPIALIGLASMAAGVGYTAGPYPLGYHGLGDVFVFVFFGLVATVGTAWAHLGAVPPLALLVAVPPGALATAILVVNNLRDRHTDARSGKRTLAVRLGARAARVEYAACWALAAAAQAGAALLVRDVRVALPLVLLLPGAALVRKVWQRDGAALNPLLGATARAMAAWCALSAAGVWPW